MALQKQPVNVNFAQGLDTKSDPFQLPVGKFLSLKNSVFGTTGRLTKRNGFGQLSALPDESSRLATTYNGNLTAIGTSLYAFNTGSDKWIQKALTTPVDVTRLSLVKTNTNQTQCDTAIATTGLVCTVFTDQIPSGGSTTPAYKYSVSDLVTTQSIVNPTLLTTPGGTVTGAPRVFTLGQYFVIVYTGLVAGVSRLQYLALNTADPTMTVGPTSISTAYSPGSTIRFDGVVANGRLYLAWNGNDGGGAVRMSYLNASLSQGATVVFAGEVATHMSVTADTTGSTPVVWATYYDSGTNIGKTLAVSQALVTILAPTTWTTVTVLTNVTSAAQNGVNTIFSEVDNDYSYAAIESHYIRKLTCNSAGVLGTSTNIARSVGIGSKAVLYSGVAYLLSSYNSEVQPTNFLLNENGLVIARLSAPNGVGYLTSGLPSCTIIDSRLYFSALLRVQIQPVNKSQDAEFSLGVYAQTGISLYGITFNDKPNSTAEIAANLHLSGGFVAAYDGALLTEQGFFLFPEDVQVTGSTTGGTMTAQEYFYQVTYEWSDNQGNLFRSAPSIPESVTTTGATSSVTIDVPTLRLTYKTSSPVKICIYRWSTAQQVYYQVTSVEAPVLNDTSVDSVQFVDTQPDSAIVGNNILYTTGGVLENICPPATSLMTLYRSRFIVVDAENPDVLWYSKLVIQGTPVEMSDLQTIYASPTISAQTSTGGATALTAMDDKLVIFKRNAIYYMVGNGPDATGAQNDYSEPVLITSTVGSTNQNSIVFMPNGVMFQSDKGIWLLGRDIATSYLGAPVEAYNNDDVLSAINVPGTNQVRFTMLSGITLMYDYYFDQWGEFSGIPNISSTLFENLHTFIDQYGRVFQERLGSYLDGSNPVLMSFKTGWLNFAGLQGYQRAYSMYLVGRYLSPHTLSIQIGYDYASGPSQAVTFSPLNFVAPWGGEQLWGTGEAWGGPGDLEQFRVFFEQQKCEAIQIEVQELFDSTLGQVAGAGLTLSGMDFVMGMKSGYPRISSKVQVG